MPQEKFTNALIHEASPYLQQHAHNPVHWYPWGDEAFAKARREDKPIFLSIGYATCHWCHVMEHESFEDEAVADRLNADFIAIKVDREERPDIDQVYMQVAQMMTGSGGWPLNILMTAEKQPFYAATYIPKESRGGRVGMMILLPKVGQMWREKRDKLEHSAAQMSAALQRQVAITAQADVNVEALLAMTMQGLNRSFDEEHAGFGGAPKFPSPHKLLLMLREAKLKGDQVTLHRVEATLDAMRAGGLFDQIGFGFHRYATDAAWLVPHFEKMLYDQAMLMLAYTEAYQATGHARHATVVREIAEYVLREMRDSTGGFYSAEDADSEGVEGKFYLWSEAELESVLGQADAAVAAKVWRFQAAGNFHDEATGQRTGENIPHMQAWTEAGLSQHEMSIRQRLFAARELRPHPFLDDKILTDWNGLMLAALAKAAQVLNEPTYLQAAKKCADFLLQTMRNDKGELLHRYRHGDAAIAAHLDDYAFLTWGLIELYEASFDARYLQAALACNATMMQKFSAEQGGFYLTANDAEALIVRPMEAWDGAIPSGNAVAAHNLLRLARIGSDVTLEKEANRLFARFSGMVEKAPSGFTHLLSAWRLAVSEGVEVVVAGERESAEGSAMLSVLRSLYLPQAVVIWRDSASIALLPLLEAQAPMQGHVTAYVCRNFQCHAPVTSAEALRELLHENVEQGVPK